MKQYATQLYALGEALGVAPEAFLRNIVGGDGSFILIIKKHHELIRGNA